LWLTLFLVAIELLLVTVFIPGDWTERVIREESAMVRSHLGEESQICARLALLSIWLPYMALLLIPAIWDGLMRRRVKQTNYDYASPVWNRYGMLSASVAAQAVLIAFISPIAINPAILPIVMMFVCVMMGVFVGNLQKQI